MDLLATDLRVALDKTLILQGVTLEARAGELVGVIGPNGSGKSTLLNLIAGRLAPDAGEVVTGETVRIGYWAQETPPMAADRRVID